MRKQKTILIMVVSCLLLLGCVNVTSFADHGLKENILRNGQIKPMWKDTAKISLHLSLVDGRAKSRINILGTKNTTRIVADIILEQKDGSSYRRIITWSGVSANSNTLSEIKTYSAKDGTYRLRVIAKIYEGSSYYTISDSTTASY